eukprot:scaffold82503_cov88-Phaeocystis_antarctica.AAC.1
MKHVDDTLRVKYFSREGPRCLPPRELRSICGAYHTRALRPATLSGSGCLDLGKVVGGGGEHDLGETHAVRGSLFDTESHRVLAGERRAVAVEVGDGEVGEGRVEPDGNALSRLDVHALKAEESLQRHATLARARRHEEAEHLHA